MDAVRQNEIIFQRVAGKTLAEIGKSYGISHQRAAEIRKDYNSGVTGPVLAAKYHTHISTVYNAIHRPDQNAREK